MKFLKPMRNFSGESAPVNAELGHNIAKTTPFFALGRGGHHADFVSYTTIDGWTWAAFQRKLGSLLARQTMLQWTEEFETGHAEIDAQHQALIGYINRLEEMAYTTNPDRDEAEFLLNLVDFVEDYTRVHFSHEENCMARHKCRAYAENKTAHQEFLEFFRKFKHRFEAEGCRPEVLQELHEACSAWIRGHILRIDAQLKSHPDRAPAH